MTNIKKKISGTYSPVVVDPWTKKSTWGPSTLALRFRVTEYETEGAGEKTSYSEVQVDLDREVAEHLHAELGRRLTAPEVKFDAITHASAEQRDSVLANAGRNAAHWWRLV